MDWEKLKKDAAPYMAQKNPKLTKEQALDEVKELLDMTYEECWKYLQNKYGLPIEDYFVNKNYTKSMNNSRTRDGLFIHHVDEDKVILLSTINVNKRLEYPFEFHKKERLVYCNLLEHLILHLKIVEFPSDDRWFGHDVGIGGALAFLVPQLNDIFSGMKYNNWEQNIADKINELYEMEHYMFVIGKLIFVLDHSYYDYLKQKSRNKFLVEYIKLLFTSLKQRYQKDYDIWNNYEIFHAIFISLNDIWYGVKEDKFFENMTPEQQIKWDDKLEKDWEKLCDKLNNNKL